MDVLVRMAQDNDLSRLGQIASVSFAAKTRFSLGKSRTKTAEVFRGFFRLGFFSLQHTIVAEVGGRVVGFSTLKIADLKVSILRFFSLFRTQYGFLGGIRALFILPWLLLEPFDENEQVLLQFMCVDDDYRNLGIGTKLLQAIYEYALATGRREFCSYVTFENPAIRFYKRAGWVIESPQFMLPWLSYTLYKFRGFHRMTWPLHAEGGVGNMTGTHG